MTESGNRPVVEIAGDNSGTIVVGDRNVVVAGDPPLRLTALPPVPLLPSSAGPAALLGPQFELVPFTDTPAYDRLMTWLAESDTKSSYLVAGPAGYGKSRLAIQVCRRAQTLGWRVEIATSSADFSAFSGKAGKTSGNETDETNRLVLVDYADRWSRTDFQHLIERLSSWPGPLRILLVSRSETYWPLASHLLHSTNISVSTMVIDGLSSAVDLESLYREAVRCYGDALGVDPNQLEAAPRSGALSEDHMLSLHVRALLEAMGIGEYSETTAHPVRWPELSRQLIDREIHHWVRMSENPPLGIASALREAFKCTFVSTLVRGLRVPQAKAILKELGFDDIEQLLADHGTLYPSPMPDAVMWPLLPDRVGEDFVSWSLSSAPPEYRFGGWGMPTNDDLLTRLLSSKTEYQLAGQETVSFPSSVLRPALAVLADAGARWPHVAAFMADTYQRLPSLSIIAGGGVMARVAETLPIDTLASVAERMQEFKVNGPNLDLEEGLAAILERRYNDPSYSELSTNEKLVLLSSLGQSLADLGRPYDAAQRLQAAYELVASHGYKLTREGVEIEEGLDHESIARAFTTLAEQLSTLDQHSASYAIAGMAVIIYQQLYGGYEGGNPGHLAAFSAYATALANIGKEDEAVEALRTLLNHQGSDYNALSEVEKSNLASLFNNLGAYRLSSDLDEALRLLKHATGIRMELSRDNPVLFAAHLAESIHNLAYAELLAQNLETSMGLAEEVVQMRRQMVANVPGAFTGKLQRSLGLLRDAYTAAGRLDAAIATSAEYLDRFPVHAGQTPDAGKELRVALDRHVGLLKSGDRRGEIEGILRPYLFGENDLTKVADDDLSAWVVFRLCASLLEDDRHHEAVALFSRYQTELESCDVQVLDARSVFATVYEFSRLDLGFEIVGQALGYLNRVILQRAEQGAEGPDQWGLSVEASEILPRFFNGWVGSAEGRDQKDRAIDIALSAVAWISITAQLSAAAKQNAAIGLYNAAVYARIANRATEACALAEASLKLWDDLNDGSGDDDENQAGLALSLNALALSLQITTPPRLEEAADAARRSVAVAERRARAQKTLLAASDFAMTLETAALVNADMNATADAVPAMNAAVSLRVQCAQAGGERLIPALVHTCRIAETMCARLGLERSAQLWSDIEMRLPEQLRASFKQASKDPPGGFEI